MVQGSPSSQSSGPLQAFGGVLLEPALAPALVPPRLESPLMPPSTAPEPPLPVAENWEPPQAYAVNEQSASNSATRSQWLMRLGFTD
jgi:hypothetical protein